MKALRPSMKENKRYLLIKGTNIKQNVEKAILEFIGILGYAKASPKWIKINGDKGILAINREAINEVRGSFAIYSEKIEVLKVSGTLKGLKKNKPM